MCDNKQLKRKFEKREVAEKRRGRRERERGVKRGKTTTIDYFFIR
jgi:hypothetical protein